MGRRREEEAEGKVSETAAGWDMVSEVGGASLLNVVQDGQTGVLVELCCPIHAGLTRPSGLEGAGMINIRLSTRVYWHVYKAASANQSVGANVLPFKTFQVSLDC